MRKAISLSVLFSIATSLSGCAYVTATSAENHPDAHGIPIYGVKSFVVVNGQGVSTIVVPDCNQKYLLQFGSFLAKNHSTFEMSNGVLTKAESDQDSTAVIPDLINLAKIVAGTPTGGAMSGKVEGGVTDKFGVFAVRCDHDGLSLVQAFDPSTLSDVKTAAVLAPQAPVQSEGTVPPVNTKTDGTPLPGH